jgi:hypothetical protein
MLEQYSVLFDTTSTAKLMQHQQLVTDTVYDYEALVE